MSHLADKDRRLTALKKALAGFLGDGGLLEALAEVLHRAYENGTVSYQEVQSAVGTDAVDIIMAAYEWRLLVSSEDPNRS